VFLKGTTWIMATGRRYDRSAFVCVGLGQERKEIGFEVKEKRAGYGKGAKRKMG
jgi:hypothetical protein